MQQNYQTSMIMKKIIVAIVAFVALCACSNGEKKFLEYRGLSMGLPFKTFCDSLTARGFAVDSAKSDSDFKTVVMINPEVKYHVILAQKNDTLQAVQENYTMSTNDSTRQFWQAIRDQLEKDLGSWPNMPKHGDDHKIAKFEAEGGFITVTLENTYKPTLNVLYQLK